MTAVHFIPYAFFRYCEHTWIAKWIQGSMWGFALIETIHIIALTILLGTMVIVDLRVWGVALPHQSVSAVAKQIMPAFWIALVVALITGTLLFASEAGRLSHSSPFFWKIAFVTLAVLFHVTLYRWIVDPRRQEVTVFAKSVACTSLVLWLGVAVFGRAIAFLTN